MSENPSTRALRNAWLLTGLVYALIPGAIAFAWTARYWFPPSAGLGEAIVFMALLSICIVVGCGLSVAALAWAVWGFYRAGSAQRPAAAVAAVVTFITFTGALVYSLFFTGVVFFR